MLKRIMILLISCSFPAWATEPAPMSSNQAPGELTRDWLELQRSGSVASNQPQPLSGPVAARIYQRYENSFSYPIPEYFTGNEADATVIGR